MSKSEATRQRIVDAALELFAEHGYDKTTMRMVAERAGCALGLIYRYFKSREALALELYARVAVQDDARQADLLGRPLAKAFAESVHRRIEDLAPHRSALRALASAALDRDGPLSLLGEHTAPMRDAVIASFTSLVRAAPDAPPGDAERTGRALFVLQLFLVLAWLQDPSPHARHSHALVDTVADTLQLMVPMLALAGPLLARYDDILQAFIAPPPPPLATK
ncbi:MAG: helix-turn-helix domain-containing protein [Myxococcota bacterium]